MLKDDLNISIKDVYKIKGQIGKGGYAHVKMARCWKTKEQVAIKIFSKHKMSSHQID